MKHKIKVEIHKLGECSDFILKIVAANNAGKNDISAIEMQHFLMVRAAGYDFACDLAYFSNPNTLLITKDEGKSYSLTLEWIEVHELKDDLPKDLFTTGVSDLEKEMVKETEDK